MGVGYEAHRPTAGTGSCGMDAEQEKVTVAGKAANFRPNDPLSIWLQSRQHEARIRRVLPSRTHRSSSSVIRPRHHRHAVVLPGSVDANLCHYRRLGWAPVARVAPNACHCENRLIRQREPSPSLRSLLAGLLNQPAIGSVAFTPALNAEGGCSMCRARISTK
jgi:hypothetical protein